MSGISSAFENGQKSLIFFRNFLKKYAYIKFTMEKQSFHFILFLDTFISVINSDQIKHQTYSATMSQGFTVIVLYHVLIKLARLKVYQIGI